MSIMQDIFTKLQSDPSLLQDIGLDMNDAHQRFNFCQALRQIEAHANGHKEKPLGEMQQIGFDMERDLPRLGIENLKMVLNSGDIDSALKNIGMDSQALYGATALTFFDPRFWEIEHAIMQWRELFPITHLGDPADKQYNYVMERLEGKAQFTSPQSNTRYKVDVIEEEDLQGILTTAINGIPLREAELSDEEARRAYLSAGKLARRAHELESGTWFGIPTAQGQPLNTVFTISFLRHFRE